MQVYESTNRKVSTWKSRGQRINNIRQNSRLGPKVKMRGTMLARLLARLLAGVYTRTIAFPFLKEL